MQLKKTLVIAMALSTIGLIGWELYWRSRGKVPSIQDDKGLWAVERARIGKLSSNDFVFAGSSRVHFDIQMAEWEKLTGTQTVMLAMGGASPLPMVRDIARNSNFSGTLVVGITPPLFFSTTFPQAPPIAGPQERVDYHRDRTYAQRLNHWLSLPLQRNLAMIHSYEDLIAGNTDLKSLLETIKIGNRTGRPVMPPFYDFGVTDEKRSVRMLKRTETDPAFAQSVIDVWKFCLKGDLPPPDKEGTTAFFLEDVEIIQERGGKVILVRCPSVEAFRTYEHENTPRTDYWDMLVEKSGLPAYHFEDYPQLQGLNLPEWSHLSGEDADFFTRELIKILRKDGLLPNTKTP